MTDRIGQKSAWQLVLLGILMVACNGGPGFTGKGSKERGTGEDPSPGSQAPVQKEADASVPIPDEPAEPPSNLAGVYLHCYRHPVTDSGLTAGCTMEDATGQRVEAPAGERWEFDFRLPDGYGINRTREMPDAGSPYHVLFHFDGPDSRTLVEGFSRGMAVNRIHYQDGRPPAMIGSPADLMTPQPRDPAHPVPAEIPADPPTVEPSAVAEAEPEPEPEPEPVPEPAPEPVAETDPNPGNPDIAPN